jgi:hypothetical protein
MFFISILFFKIAKNLPWLSALEIDYGTSQIYTNFVLGINLT